MNIFSQYKKNRFLFFLRYTLWFVTSLLVMGIAFYSSSGNKTIFVLYIFFMQVYLLLKTGVKDKEDLRNISIFTIINIGIIFYYIFVADWY